jgi:hypothetical protein
MSDQHVRLRAETDDRRDEDRVGAARRRAGDARRRADAARQAAGEATTEYARAAHLRAAELQTWIAEGHEDFVRSRGSPAGRGRVGR